MVAVEKWFLVNTPERGFTVVQTTKGGTMDFEIFEVRKAAKPYVRIYLGNAADFPREIIAGPDGRRTKIVTHPGGVTTDEFLLATTARGWPSQVHVMELVVPEDQEAAHDIARHVSAR